MSINTQVNALTRRVNDQFWKAWNQVAKPAPVDSIMTRIPSTTRVEFYLNATPVPGFSLWMGTRNFGQIDSFIYPILNRTFTAEISAKLEDIEDDQVGLMEKQPGFLAEKGKLFPGRQAQKLVGQALNSPIALRGGLIGNLNAFDGLPFYSNRLTSTPGAFGSGNNLVSFTSASGDGLKYNLTAMFTGAPELKPMGWQERSPVDLHTNSGSPAALEARRVKWWADLRGAAFFTYFWNSVACQITNTPNVAEMLSIFQLIESAFRTFQYPTSVASADGEYPHEQTVFEKGNLVYFASTALATQLRQAMREQLVPQNIGGNTVAVLNPAGETSYTWFVSRFLDMQ